MKSSFIIKSLIEAHLLSVWPLTSKLSMLLVISFYLPGADASNDSLRIHRHNKSDGTAGIVNTQNKFFCFSAFFSLEGREKLGESVSLLPADA